MCCDAAFKEARGELVSFECQTRRSRLQRKKENLPGSWQQQQQDLDGGECDCSRNLDFRSSAAAAAVPTSSVKVVVVGTADAICYSCFASTWTGRGSQDREGWLSGVLVEREGLPRFATGMQVVSADVDSVFSPFETAWSALEMRGRLSVCVRVYLLFLSSFPLPRWLAGLCFWFNISGGPPSDHSGRGNPAATSSQQKRTVRSKSAHNRRLQT
ncbi:hypothetical protein BC567DRAFT_217868 [Phyllosticta citribraziliensis]